MLKYWTEEALPYASDGVAGIGGKLRAVPEHFDVEEIALYDASGEGEHLYVNITKVGLTTKAVQADLARVLGLSRSQVGVAGLKDKNARTSQTYSLNIGRGDEARAQEVAERIEGELPVEVNWARYHTNKLKVGHLLGNRFVVVVSDPNCEEAECLERCQEIRQVLQARGVPNYFGPQRFGQDGGNVRQGLDILDGSVKVRDKWLRKFLAGSVQSWLCNEYLAERMRTGAYERLLAGDIAKKYETGGMFAVEDLAAEQVRYEAHEISFTAPLFGPKMWSARGDSGGLETRILESASLNIDDFKKVRVSGTRRMGRLLVDDLQVSAHERGVQLDFSLPKGAYATTVLREFMKAGDDTDLAGEEDSGEDQ